MANDLQRIYNEVSTTVKTARARSQSDVLNVTGSVLQYIVDMFGYGWPEWLLNTDTFTQTTQTKDLNAAFSPALYSNRIKDLWILDIGRIEGPYNISTFDPMLSTYPTGVPCKWGWASHQVIQFDYIPSGYTIQARYQGAVTTVNSSSTITDTPDIPGSDGFDLLLQGVKEMLKRDTDAVDMLEQNALWMKKFNAFYDRYAIEDDFNLSLTYS